MPPTAAEHTPPAPSLDLMARFEVSLGAPWEFGDTSPLGRRRIIPITGGQFSGPLLNGEILDNGADWQIVTREGVALIDTRYLLRLDDGALGYLQTRGVRHGPTEVVAALARGEDVDPARYYFRVTLHFETASQRYGWLNHTLGLGSAIRRAQTVLYDAYAVR